VQTTPAPPGSALDSMTPFDAVARNSARLFHEGISALEAKRFATATALAIFSIEEAAKYVIFVREAKRPQWPKKLVFRHEVKHEEMGEYFWYWAIYAVFSDTFKDFKSFAERQPRADPKIMDFIASLSGGQAVDFIRFNLFDTEAEMRAYVKQHFAHPELLEIAEAGSGGVVEVLRRRCLYVDLSDNRDSVRSSPESVTEAEANEWLKVAWFGQEYIKLADRVWAKKQPITSPQAGR
jgi:AbiV family abortive infection protein